MSPGREEARALLGGLGFGPGSQGSLITLATSGACPGNSGFSSVICTSRSSAMVPWRGEETQRLGGCLHTTCLPQPPASSLNTGQCWVRRAPGAKDYSRTQREAVQQPPAAGPGRLGKRTQDTTSFQSGHPNTPQHRHLRTPSPILDGNTRVGQQGSSGFPGYI